MATPESDRPEGTQVDHLLSKAEQTLAEAAQTTGADTAEAHTALLAEVDQAC